MNEQIQDNYIWCIETKHGIIPIGESKSYEYAMECKDGYSDKDAVLYRLIKVKDKK